MRTISQVALARAHFAHAHTCTSAHMGNTEKDRDENSHRSIHARAHSHTPEHRCTQTHIIPLEESIDRGQAIAVLPRKVSHTHAERQIFGRHYVLDIIVSMDSRERLERERDRHTNPLSKAHAHIHTDAHKHTQTKAPPAHTYAPTHPPTRTS